jgi:hypothetical protein
LVISALNALLKIPCFEFIRNANETSSPEDVAKN